MKPGDRERAADDAADAFELRPEGGAATAFKHLRPYRRPSDYFGATWYGYYPVDGQHRDSGHLDQSNFEGIWAELEALQSDYTAGPDDLNDNAEGEILDSVVRTVCNHWAVGWVETLYVHESNRAALEHADALLERLEDYPVLDDDDLSQREWTAASEYWSNASMRERARILRECRSRVSLFAVRRDELPQDDDGRIFDYCRGD
jgi:hypothetical protein